MPILGPMTTMFHDNGPLPGCQAQVQRPGIANPEGFRETVELPGSNLAPNVEPPSESSPADSGSGNCESEGRQSRSQVRHSPIEGGIQGQFDKLPSEEIQDSRSYPPQASYVPPLAPGATIPRTFDANIGDFHSYLPFVSRQVSMAPEPERESPSSGPDVTDDTDRTPKIIPATASLGAGTGAQISNEPTCGDEPSDADSIASFHTAHEDGADG